MTIIARMWRIYMTALIAILIVGLPTQSAVAEPCGEVALEGRCNGNVREYCNAGELQTETCASCCGWGGDRYECLDSCPAAGECIEECLEGVDVFGCSLSNTHEWTCTVGADGCTDRVFVACADGQICDESTTNMCRPIGEVDLCSGIDEAGECKGDVFKQCVGGQLTSVDCAATGQACTATGCATCTDECSEGETGCVSAAQAWTCVPSAINGCLVEAAKNCSGGKVCYEGACIFESEIPSGDDVSAAEGETTDTTDSTSAPAPATDSGGCATSGWAPDEMSDGLWAVICTLLGLLLFVRIARRSE